MKNNKNFIFIVSILGFFFLINLFSVSLKFKNIKSSSFYNIQQALDSIFKAESSAKALNLEEATLAFQTANQYFQELQENSWVFQNQLISPVEVTKAGQIISQTAEDLLILSKDLKEYPNKFFELNKQAILDPDSLDTSINLTTQISQTKELINSSQKNLAQASEILESQSYNLLPSDLQSKYENGLAQIQNLQQIFTRLDKLLTGTQDLLGSQTAHRYLVLVQNQNELRPLGGFLGGVMTFEIDKGIIQNIQFQDIYDIDGQASQTLPVPPEFEGFTDQIFSRDANYTPSLMVSGPRINSLLQDAKQPNYHTIISLNHSLVSDVLQKTGHQNITIDDQDYYITAENFSLIFNTIVEIDQNKNIVEPIIKQIQQNMFTQLSPTDIATLVLSSFQKKDILFFTENKNIYKEYQTSYLYNESLPKDEDFLFITQTNIGGNKSDQYIQTDINHDTSFQENNDVINTLTINRTNQYSNQVEIRNMSLLAENNIYSIPDELRYVLGRGTNKVSTKIYIPQQANLISWEGDITTPQELFDEDMDKKYILFTQELNPQESKQVQLKFRYKPTLNSRQPISTYNFKLVKSLGFTYNFTKTYSSTQQSYTLNTPKFTTTKNTPFRVESTIATPNKDTDYPVYIYR